VLEKGWRLSGYLSTAFGQLGIPGVLIENDARCWSEPIGEFRTLMRYLFHRTSQRLASFYSCRVPAIIAETEELKAMLIKQRGILPDRLEVIGLGVDHKLFYPRSQQFARSSLGISPDAILMLYVGGMDLYWRRSRTLDRLIGNYTL
jgi:hypothetical protein